MRELHPQDKDQKVTKSKKAEDAQQSPVLTSTYFYREHSLGPLVPSRVAAVSKAPAAMLHCPSVCALIHLSQPPPLHYCLSIFPFSLPSTASCSEKHPLTGLWEMPHHQEVGALQ